MLDFFVKMKLVSLCTLNATTLIWSPKIARNSKSRKSDRQKTWQNVLGRSDKNGRNGHSTTPKKAVNTGLGKTI